MLHFCLVLTKNSVQKIPQTQNVSKLRFFKAAWRRNTVSYFKTDNEEKADFQPFWAGSDYFVSVRHKGVEPNMPKPMITIAAL